MCSSESEVEISFPQPLVRARRCSAIKANYDDASGGCRGQEANEVDMEESGKIKAHGDTANKNDSVPTRKKRGRPRKESNQPNSAQKSRIVKDYRLCGKVFDKNNNLMKRHFLSQTEQKSLKCFSCEKDQLKLHEIKALTTANVKSPTHRCSCGEEFVNESDFVCELKKGNSGHKKIENILSGDTTADMNNDRVGSEFARINMIDDDDDDDTSIGEEENVSVNTAHSNAMIKSNGVKNVLRCLILRLMRCGGLAFRAALRIGGLRRTTAATTRPGPVLLHKRTVYSAALISLQSQSPTLDSALHILGEKEGQKRKVSYMLTEEQIRALRLLGVDVGEVIKETI